jgi:Beta-propeller repeat/IPT/TIG domain
MAPAIIAFLAVASFCCAQSFPSFRWIVEVDGSGADQLAGLAADAQGNTYLAGTTASSNFQVKAAAQDHLAGSTDVFVTKLDPAGNVVYSTYFGGSGNENATAIAVDPQGNAYVTGFTNSSDFPTTPGAYRSVPLGGGVFLIRLNPDGSAGYATYFTDAETLPNAIAVDRSGSVYLAGISYGGLPTTSGAYRTSCTCVPPGAPFSFSSINDSFLTRFNPTGSQLIFSTYLGAPLAANALALGPDGSAYLAGTPTRSDTAGVFRVNADGTALIASGSPGLNAQALALARDGSVYMAGITPTSPAFVPTPGAFQPAAGLAPGANAPPGGIVKMDPLLRGVLAATYFGGAFGTFVRAMTLDPDGNVYLGGHTSPRSLPTRIPFQLGFGLASTGFVAKLSGDLSTLLFSSPFGDNETFSVTGLSIGEKGNVVLGGATGSPAQNVWANSLLLPDPPALRIDSILDATSRFSDPLSAGEALLIQGAGFGADTQLLIGGELVTPLSLDPTHILAAMPRGLPGATATVQVSSGGANSNSVLVALAQ